jgi:hypothetical protein
MSIQGTFYTVYEHTYKFSFTEIFSVIKIIFKKSINHTIIDYDDCAKFIKVKNILKIPPNKLSNDITETHKLINILNYGTYLAKSYHTITSLVKYGYIHHYEYNKDIPYYNRFIPFNNQEKILKMIDVLDKDRGKYNVFVNDPKKKYITQQHVFWNNC